MASAGSEVGMGDNLCHGILSVTAGAATTHHHMVRAGVLLIPTYCRVPRVGNTDDIQTAAARQTGRTPTTITKLTISDLRFTTTWCYSIYITTIRSSPPCQEKSVEALRSIGIHRSYQIVGVK